MEDIKALQQERTQLFLDVWSNKIPKRVPVNVSLTFEAVAQFGELDLARTQWNPAQVAEAADKVCQAIYSDSCPAGTVSLRFPAHYEVLKSQSFIMSESGFVQHPEVVGMLPEEYDYLIEKPYECLVEKVIPRQFKALGLDDPVKLAFVLAKAIAVKNADVIAGAGVSGQLTQKYGYSLGAGAGVSGSSEAPMDYLADQLRSFTGIVKDIRRIPEKVIDGVEALFPIVYRKGTPARITEFSRVTYPLHMPTFLKQKDFEKFWWPSFFDTCNNHAAEGVSNGLWCEDNWMRFLDNLEDLPDNTQLIFEYGDPKTIKDKLGKKHIITGLFPINLIKNGTKQEVLDKAKEMIDILAPGGGYIFAFDKIIITADSVNMDNLAALTEFVRDYAVYDNPGAPAGTPFHKEDYTIKPHRTFESVYHYTADDYKKMNPMLADSDAAKLTALDESIFGFITSLLI